jgi:hypothetical protein
MRAGSATTYAGNTLLKTPEAHSLAIICFKKTKISLLIGRLTAGLPVNIGYRRRVVGARALCEDLGNPFQGLRLMAFRAMTMFAGRSRASAVLG